MNYQWTLDQLRMEAPKDLMKYIRDGLVAGVPPRVADAEAPWLQMEPRSEE